MNTMSSSRSDRFRTLGFRSGLLAGLLCLLLVGSAFLFPPLVHAGANGQQVAVASNKYDVFSFWIDGKNQKGEQVGTCLNYSNNPGLYKGLPNWWWVGTIRIVEYAGLNCQYPADYLCQGSHNVPKSQSADWVLINADDGCQH